MSARAVITGRGAVTPAGVGVVPLWQAVAGGVSQVQPEQQLNVSELPISAVSARLRRPDLQDVRARWSSERRSDAEALLWEVIEQSLAESGVESQPHLRTTLLTTQLFESGFEGSSRQPGYGDECRQATAELPLRYVARRPLPREGVGSRLIADLSARLGGPLAVQASQATCATGLRLVCDAARLIQLGRADRVVVAVVSRPVDAMHFASFARALTLSRWQGLPAAASRPFDRQRTGFVLGEAAAALVLESEQVARERGARAFARIRGWGLAMSAHHFLRPSLRHLVRVMRQALATSGVEARDIALLSAMGSSTLLGDSEEARAIHRVFGSEIENLSISAEKAVLGYSVQAAALTELIACTAAMQEGLAPPIAHCEEQDADVELPISREAKRRSIGLVLKHAFGLGGHYGALILEALG